MTLLEILGAAEDFAAAHGLDFSEKSLAGLDALVTPERVTAMACYLGEVYCRNLKGAWVLSGKEPCVELEHKRHRAYVFESVRQRLQALEPVTIEAIYRVAKSAVVGSLVAALSDAPPAWRRVVEVKGAGQMDVRTAREKHLGEVSALLVRSEQL
jgi:hypothetical protein